MTSVLRAQVLCSSDAAFRNEVVWCMASNDLRIEVPITLLTPGAAADSSQPHRLVAVVVKGRTACELLVQPLMQPGSPAPLSSKLVAVHYTKLLEHASLDALLALSEKIQVREALVGSRVGCAAACGPLLLGY
jgi:hypothetical protein